MFVLKLNADGTLGTSNHVVREIPYRFYPNPVSDRLNIHYSPDVTPKAVELYDVQGRLIHTQHNNLENIGMENLPAGNYTLRVVMHDGNTYSEKVVKL
jgi:DNA gyrase inhibitor GyrI